MSRVAAKDNLALQERTVLLGQLGTLLQTVNQASGEQRAAIDAIVASASSVMERAGTQFVQVLDTHAGKAGEMATQLAGSALEVASLAEAFSAGVQSFQASNDKLSDTLQRIEASLDRSTTRSDEQLAYYVAQAREVIDLSIASQQGLVEKMRQLTSGKPARTLAVVEGARA
jgi:methyl-accepting chemotaxis protein